MKAMVLKKLASLEACKTPLEFVELPAPVPGSGEILVKVSTCGVCHTELDEIEGRTEPPYLPVVLGHQVVGRVEALGREVTGFAIGDRVGVAWIYSACGICQFCLEGNENLCPEFKGTGRNANSGRPQGRIEPESCKPADNQRVLAIRVPHLFDYERTVIVEVTRQDRFEHLEAYSN